MGAYDDARRPRQQIFAHAELIGVADSCAPRVTVAGRHAAKFKALKDEELDALLLADANRLQQEAAARLMNISRSTFSRILAQARKTVAAALSEGAAIEIRGGDFRRVTAEDSALDEFNAKAKP